MCFGASSRVDRLDLTRKSQCSVGNRRRQGGRYLRTYSDPEGSNLFYIPPTWAVVVGAAGRRD